jgi:hypothetical protein
MKRHDELIGSLSKNLQPVEPATNIDRVALLWLLLSAGYVIGLTHAMGPIRPGAFTQLASELHFLLETLAGVVAIITGAVLAFRSTVPGSLNSRWIPFGIALLLLWLCSYVFGLVAPALEPSMLGKRDHCASETLILAIPPMLLGFYLTRRFYPLNPVRTALCYSLMAGMMPALYMQIACMYEPTHILTLHVLPGVSVGLVGMVAAMIIQGVRQKTRGD